MDWRSDIKAGNSLNAILAVFGPESVRSLNCRRLPEFYCPDLCPPSDRNHETSSNWVKFNSFRCQTTLRTLERVRFPVNCMWKTMFALRWNMVDKVIRWAVSVPKTIRGTGPDMPTLEIFTDFENSVGARRTCVLKSVAFPVIMSSFFLWIGVGWGAAIDLRKFPNIIIKLILSFSATNLCHDFLQSETEFRKTLWV